MEPTGVCLLKTQLLTFYNHHFIGGSGSWHRYGPSRGPCAMPWTHFHKFYFVKARPPGRSLRSRHVPIKQIQSWIINNSIKNQSIKNKKKNQSRIILFNHLQLRLTTTQKRERKEKEVKLINSNPIPLLKQRYGANRDK